MKEKVIVETISYESCEELRKTVYLFLLSCFLLGVTLLGVVISMFYYDSIWGSFWKTFVVIYCMKYGINALLLSCKNIWKMSDEELGLHCLLFDFQFIKNIGYVLVLNKKKITNIDIGNGNVYFKEDNVDKYIHFKGYISETFNFIIDSTLTKVVFDLVDRTIYIPSSFILESSNVKTPTM